VLLRGAHLLSSSRMSVCFVQYLSQSNDKISQRQLHVQWATFAAAPYGGQRAKGNVNMEQVPESEWSFHLTESCQLHATALLEARPVTKNDEDVCRSSLPLGRP
jgi:hypothetical protein